MTSAFDAPPGTPPPPRAIVGGTLIDGTGRPPVRRRGRPRARRKHRVRGPASRAACPRASTRIDARGKLVDRPGSSTRTCTTRRPAGPTGGPTRSTCARAIRTTPTERRLREHPEVFHRAYLASGVTAVFDVGGYPWTLAHGARGRGRHRARPTSPRPGRCSPRIDLWLNLPGERQFIFLKDGDGARRGRALPEVDRRRRGEGVVHRHARAATSTPWRAR